MVAGSDFIAIPPTRIVAVTLPLIFAVAVSTRVSPESEGVAFTVSAALGKAIG